MSKVKKNSRKVLIAARDASIVVCSGGRSRNMTIPLRAANFLGRKAFMECWLIGDEILIKLRPKIKVEGQNALP